MSARQWFSDAQSTNQGMVYLDFSFLANGASDPATSSFRGNLAVASVVHSATGKYTITLADGYRFCVAKYVDIDDLNSSDDGAYATSGPVGSEGSGHTTGCTLIVYTRAAAGTKTDYSARRVSVSMCLKNSGNGS